MQILLPESVKPLMGRLEAAGFEVFCVGGCVRDALLCREPSDWDIATAALPFETRPVSPS